MKRYILTGAPGAGKTALLLELERLGFPVVPEAATDVIAREQANGIDEAWRDPAFPDRIAALQTLRLERARHLPGDIQFHDRSVICTLALARYLGTAVSAELERHVATSVDGGLFERRVFFVDLMGSIVPTAARRIDYESAQRFAEFHVVAYEQCGFEIVHVAPAGLAERTAFVLRAVTAATIPPPAGRTRP